MKITLEGPAGPRFKKLRVAIEFSPEETAEIGDELVQKVIRADSTGKMLACLDLCVQKFEPRTRGKKR
jgi:hypothetical protein